MFDLGMGELLIIGVVALIIIGPKDLPGMFRTMGRFTAKMRAMAREFSRAMESAADEAGVKDVARDLKAATSAKSMGLDAVKDAAAKFEKWDPMKNAARPTPAAPAPAMAAAAANPTLAAPAAPLGPATQALADKKAARQAVVQEATARLRAVDAPAPPTAPAAKPRAAAKPKVAVTPASPAVPAKAPPAKAARKPRAKAKAPEAEA